MTNIFSELKNMNHQLSNALSTMFLRHLVIFLHFETYALANPQKAGLCPKSGCELDFLPHIHDMRSKCTESILRAKTEVSRAIEKSFFLTPQIGFWLLRSVAL